MPNILGVDSTGQSRNVLLDESGVTGNNPAPVAVSVVGGTGTTVSQGDTNGQANDAWFVELSDGTTAISAANPLPIKPGTNITFVVTGAAAAALALAAPQTDGTQKSIVRGGAKGATTPVDVTSTANGSDHQGADVVEQYAPTAEDNTNGVYGIVQKPIAVNTYAPSLAANFGAATKANVKASAGNVLGCVGTNANVLARWLQLHNKASAPAATEVPLYSFYVPTSGNIVIGTEFFAGSGGAFSIGIGWAWSTTAGTFTDAATAADHTTHIHYK